MNLKATFVRCTACGARTEVPPRSARGTVLAE
jgi:hypothetical protein